MTLEKVTAILKEASDTVNGPRQAAYGHPKVNFQRIADIWNVHLASKMGVESVVGTNCAYHRITARDVAIMLIGLKLAREAQSPKHDSLVDIIGYAALAEELE